MDTHGIRSAARHIPLILLLFPACAVDAVAEAQEQLRSPEAAFVVPWGDGDSELGFRAGPEMEPFCVQTWCRTLSGTFLLLDPVARSLKEYDAQGELVAIRAAGLGGTSVATDAQGNAYVLEGAEIRRIGRTRGSERIARLPQPVPPGYGQGLTRPPVAGGALPVVDRGRIRHRVRSPSGDAMVEALPEDARMRRLTTEGRDRASSARYGTLDLGEGVGTVLLFGDDDAGRNYVEVERRIGGGWELEVWVLDADSDRAVERFSTGACDDVSVLYRRLALAPDGTVYRARTTPDGFELRKFAPAGGAR